MLESDGVEEGMESEARLVGGLGAEYVGGLLFGDGETATEEAPVFFYFAHAALVADGQEVDGFNEGEDEAECGMEVVGLLVLDAEGEEWVVEDAAPYHVVFYLREPLPYAAIVGGGADVAVVDDAVVEQGQHAVEGVEVYLSGVLLPPGAWMDGDVAEGIVVKYGDETENLVGAVQPEAHFDAEGGEEPGDNAVEDGTHFVGVGEDAAAAVLCRHPAHGAADIPVYLVVADVVEAVGESDEFVGLFAQYLGDDGDGIEIGFGQDVVDFFPCIGQVTVGEGEEGGDGIVERSRETLVVYFPEQQFGQTLHGGENQHDCLALFSSASSFRLSMM